MLIYLRKEDIILTIQYPVHCKDENSPFITHNSTFALSNTTNQLLVSSESNPVNSSGSLECLSLTRTLQTIDNQIKSTVNKDLIYDVNNAIKCIAES